MMQIIYRKFRIIKRNSDFMDSQVLSVYTQNLNQIKRGIKRKY